MVCMDTCSLEDFPDFDVTVSHPATDHLGKTKATSVPDPDATSSHQPTKSRKIKLAPPVSHRNARSEHRDNDAASISSSVGDGELELSDDQVHNSYRWDKLVPHDASIRNDDDKSSIGSIKDNSSVKENVMDTLNGSISHEDRSEHEAAFKRTPPHPRYKIFPHKESIPVTSAPSHVSISRGESDAQPNLPSPKTLPLSVPIQHHKPQQDSNVMIYASEAPSPETTPDDSILSTVSSESHTSPSGIDVGDKPQYLEARPAIVNVSPLPLSHPHKLDRQSLIKREKSTSSVHTRLSLKIDTSIPSTPSLDQSLPSSNSARNSILIPLQYFISSGANDHHFDINADSSEEDGQTSLEASDSPTLITKRHRLLPGNTELPSTRLSISDSDIHGALASPVGSLNSENCHESRSSGQETVQSAAPTEMPRHKLRNASHKASLPMNSTPATMKSDALLDGAVGIERLPNLEKSSGQVADATVEDAAATASSEHVDKRESNARQSVCTIDAILEEFEQIASLSANSTPRLTTYSGSDEPQTAKEALHEDVSALDQVVQAARDPSTERDHQVVADDFESLPMGHDDKQLEVSQALVLPVHEGLDPTQVPLPVDEEVELADKLSLGTRPQTYHFIGVTAFDIEVGEMREISANNEALEDEEALIAQLEELSHNISVGHLESCPVEYIPKMPPDQAHASEKGHSQKAAIETRPSATKTTIEEGASKAPASNLASSKSNIRGCVESNILNHTATQCGYENPRNCGKDGSRDVGWTSPPSEMIKKLEHRDSDSIQKRAEPRADASIRPAAGTIFGHNIPDSPLLPATQPFREPSFPAQTRPERAELGFLKDEPGNLAPRASSQDNSPFSHTKSDQDDLAGACEHSEKTRILCHKSSPSTFRTATTGGEPKTSYERLAMDNLPHNPCSPFFPNSASYVGFHEEKRVEVDLRSAIMGPFRKVSEHHHGRPSSRRNMSSATSYGHEAETERRRGRSVDIGSPAKFSSDSGTKLSNRKPAGVPVPPIPSDFRDWQIAGEQVQMARPIHDRPRYSVAGSRRSKNVPVTAHTAMNAEQYEVARPSIGS